MIKARYQKMYTEKHKQDMDFVIIGDYYLGPFINMDVAQKAVSAINKQLAPQPNIIRTEYEKVTECFWDLRDEFERGELYCKHEHATDHSMIVHIQTLVQALHGGFCYRKVEKEIDWQTLVSEFVRENNCNDAQPGESFDVDGLVLMDDDFLEMCRVALRATGELE